MTKRTLQIIAVAVVALVIIGSGVVVAFTSSPKYALYQMYHAAQTNNNTAFTKIYKVYTPKTAFNQKQPPALATFKKLYYKPLSLWDAMFKVKNEGESITPDGTILMVQSQKPVVAYQMLKRDGGWVALSAGVLK